MGIYRKFVDGAQDLNKVSDKEPSKRIITPPTVMTGARIPLALKASERLVRGRKGASPWVALMALSDAEGSVARWIDKKWPDSGMGVSEFGAPADTAADLGGILVVAGAELLGPRVPKLAKAAVGIAFGQEAVKGAWYLRTNKQHKLLTIDEEHPKGQSLILPIDNEGKEAMVEKFGAIFFAALANDTDNSLLRTAFSGIAMGHAGSGSARGERIRQGYEHMAEDVLGQLALNRAAAGFDPLLPPTLEPQL